MLHVLFFFSFSLLSFFPFSISVIATFPGCFPLIQIVLAVSAPSRGDYLFRSLFDPSKMYVHIHSDFLVNDDDHHRFITQPPDLTCQFHSSLR